MADVYWGLFNNIHKLKGKCTLWICQNMHGRRNSCELLSLKVGSLYAKIATPSIIMHSNTWNRCVLRKIQFIQRDGKNKKLSFDQDLFTLLIWAVCEKTKMYT